MAKQGMKRPDRTHTRNTEVPVPELQGRAKSGKANPIIPGTSGPEQKVWHAERPIPENAWGPMDNDLARDNLEQDIPFADLQDI